MQGATTRRRVERAWARPPISPTRPALGSQVRQWKHLDAFSTHPGYGADPQVVNSIFRSAETGQLARQCDLFDDLIESDGHLRALIEARVAAVAGRDWVIQAGEQDDASIKAAKALERVLRDSMNFRPFREHQLSASYYGYACTEVLWEFRDGMHVPAWFLNVPHARFVFDEWGELRLVQEHLHQGEALEPGRWVVNRMPHKNLARAGLMRTAAWWALFKRMSVRDWIIFVEKFGIPNVIGTYEATADQEAIDALHAAVEDIGEAGQAVMSEATKIHFQDVQRGGDASNLHPSLVSLCEEQISKLINGSTLTTQSGGPGSYALGRVHESRQFSLEKSDADRLAHVFRHQIGMPFVRFNGFEGASAPVLKIQLMQDMSPQERAKVALDAQELGCELDRSQLMDEFGFRSPAREEDALRGRSPDASPEGEGEKRPKKPPAAPAKKGVRDGA